MKEVFSPGPLSENDFFIDNPPQQPKAEIANYVESQGFLVPKRFETLNAALSSGRPFIIRAEHPQDYAGASGIVDSWVITDELRNIAFDALHSENSNQFYPQLHVNNARKLHQSTLVNIHNLPQQDVEKNIIKYSNTSIKEFCRLRNINQDFFESNISFSYWELVDGNLLKIIADSTIPKRFHVFLSPQEGYSASAAYYMYDSEKERLFFGGQKLRTSIPNFLERYKSISSLPKFSKAHTSVMEMTEKDGKIYFLQYLKSRPFSFSNFVLDNQQILKGGIEADWVRGATPSEGVICNTKFWYPNEAIDLSLSKEDSSFDFHHNFIFAELMTEMRKVQFVMHTSLAMMPQYVSVRKHLPVSKLFKPPVSVYLSRPTLEKLVPELKDRNLPGELSDFSVKFHIVSDGNRAFIRRV